MNRIGGWVLALVACTLLTACLDQYADCQEPKSLQVEEITGNWAAHYVSESTAGGLSGSTAGGLIGEEKLVFYADGTYQQTFTSNTYNYSSPKLHWSINMNPADGPKLKMEGMKFFPAGASSTNNPTPMTIGPQMPDELRIQENNDSRKFSSPFGAVTYPSDGFIYLYPRQCWWQLELLQMVAERIDPDDWSIKNPIFRRN